MTWSGTVPDFTVIEELLAADLQTISDILTALTEPWEAYAPAWTGGSPAIGNGTLQGFYIEIGKLTLFRINLIAGSTTTFGSTAWTLGLPVTHNVATGQAVGKASLNDSSATGNRMGRLAWVNGATGIALGDESAGRVSNTVPFTWASGDQCTVSGFYEGA
jgi:hypothetical protein